MKIYTKTGDKGTTSLFGGARVNKDDLRIEAYGTIDELNATLAMLIECIDQNDLKASIIAIQSSLFDMGSYLAADPSGDFKMPGVDAEDCNTLEKLIDQYNKDLKPLTNFVLPGGSEGNARAHLARTICRRAERRVVSLQKVSEVKEEIVIYLNRLSDLLFIISRWIAQEKGTSEILWTAKK